MRSEVVRRLLPIRTRPMRPSGRPSGRHPICSLSAWGCRWPSPWLPSSGLSPAAPAPPAHPARARPRRSGSPSTTSGPPAIDPTRVGGITIQEIALSPSSPWSSWTAPGTLSTRASSVPFTPWARTSRQGRPPSGGLLFAPANLEKPHALGRPPEQLPGSQLHYRRFHLRRCPDAGPRGDASSAGRIAEIPDLHEQGTTSRGTTSRAGRPPPGEPPAGGPIGAADCRAAKSSPMEQAPVLARLADRLLVARLGRPAARRAIPARAVPSAPASQATIKRPMAGWSARAAPRAISATMARCSARLPGQECPQ